MGGAGPQSSLDVLQQVAQNAGPQGGGSGGPQSSLDVLKQVSSAPPAQAASQQDRGFLQGAWDTTLGGVKSLADDIANYYKSRGPAALLTDAAKDPEHPIHKMLVGMLANQLGEGVKAVASAKEGHGFEAAGHGLAAAIPVVGPAAAKAGEDLGGKEPGYGAGEAAGLIGTALLPEVGRGAGEAVEGVGPGVKAVAGGDIPVRGSMDSGVAQLLEKGASAKALTKFDLTRTQPAVKSALGKVASKVATEGVQDTVNPLRMSTDEFANVSRDLPKQMTFGEAAEAIRGVAQEQFQKLDDLSDGAWSRAQRAAKTAWRVGDDAAIQDASAAQEAILEQHAAEFSPAELQQAKSAWRQGSALDALHESIQGAIHDTPAELADFGKEDPGYINGKQLRERIFKLGQKDGSGNSVLQDAVKDPKQAQAIQDFGLLLEKSNNVTRLNKGMQALSAAGQVVGGALTSGGAGMVKGAGAVATEFAVAKGLGKLLTNESMLKTTAKWVRGGATTTALVNAVKQGAFGSKAQDASSRQAGISE